MSRRGEEVVAPLKRLDGEPVFDEPWQAEVLAIADALVQAGIVTPPAWTGALGAALQEAATRGEPDSAATYYASALVALERVAEAACGISGEAAERTREAWRAAYLATPHGEPVRKRETTVGPMPLSGQRRTGA